MNNAPQSIADFNEKHGVYWLVHAVSIGILKDNDALDPGFFEMHGLAYSDEERDRIMPHVDGELISQVLSPCSGCHGVAGDSMRAGDVFSITQAIVLRHYFRVC